MLATGVLKRVFKSKCPCSVPDRYNYYKKSFLKDNFLLVTGVLWYHITDGISNQPPTSFCRLRVKRHCRKDGWFYCSGGQRVKEIAVLRFTHINGLPNVPKSAEVWLRLYDDRIEFDQASIVSGQTKEEMGRSYVLFEQLISGGMVSNLEAEASVTLRNAIVGGILFGGAGAIVGSIIGSEKKKTVVEHYLVLNYKSSTDGTPQSIYFTPFPDNDAKYKQFMKMLAEMATSFVFFDDLPNRFEPVHL